MIIKQKTTTNEIPIYNQYDVGVVVGRFQTNSLHEAHKNLIDRALMHRCSVILIGTSATPHTKNNPLDFETRYRMIREYANSNRGTNNSISKACIVLPIVDTRENDDWDKTLDTKLDEIFPFKSKVLYSGENGFLTSYKGKYDGYMMNLLPVPPATDQRGLIAKTALNSSDFRSGCIYTTQNQFTRVSPCIDAIIYDDNKRLLLGRKPGETRFRFVGGFVDTYDKTLEDAVTREVKEELTENIEISDIKYLTNIRVNDWRVKHEQESIMTMVFTAKFLFGNPEAADDIEECKWFDLNYLTTNRANILVKEHQKIFEIYLKSHEA